MGSADKAAEQARAADVEHSANGTGAWQASPHKRPAPRLSDEDWLRDMGELLTSGDAEEFREAAHSCLEWLELCEGANPHPGHRAWEMNVGARRMINLGELVVKSLLAREITADYLRVEE